MPLVNALPADVRLRLAEVVARLEPEQLDHVVRDAGSAPHTLATLLSLASQMKDADRASLIAAIDRADRSAAEQLVTRLSEAEQLGELLEVITPDVMSAVERAAERLGMQTTLRQALHTVRVPPQP